MDNGDMMPETMAICRYLAREYSKLKSQLNHFYLMTFNKEINIELILIFEMLKW